MWRRTRTAAALLLALAGCAAPPAGDAAADETLQVPPPDAWESAAAERPNQQGCVQVRADLLVPVATARRAAAERRLAQSPIVELAAGDALLEGMAPGAAGLRPYLVRGVAKNLATGAFTAEVCSGVLWVSHRSLGRDIPPSERVPLVVLLDRRPARLFVSVGMAM